MPELSSLHRSRQLRINRGLHLDGWLRRSRLSIEKLFYIFAFLIEANDGNRDADYTEPLRHTDNFFCVFLWHLINGHLMNAWLLFARKNETRGFSGFFLAATALPAAIRFGFFAGRVVGIFEVT